MAEAPPNSFVKSAILVWSAVLGLLFVVGFTAVAFLGTKSSGTFSYVGSKTPGTPAPQSTTTPSPAAGQ